MEDLNPDDRAMDELARRESKVVANVTSANENLQYRFRCGDHDHLRADCRQQGLIHE